MRLRLQKYSFRFAEQVLNSKLSLKQEIEEILLYPSIKLEELTRPRFNKILEALFITKGWTSQPQVFEDEDHLGAKMDFLKVSSPPQMHQGTKFVLCYSTVTSKLLNN